MTGCYDCGMDYSGPRWLEVLIPDKFWNEISPTGGHAGILCFWCMSERLAVLGYGNDKPPVPFTISYHGMNNRSMVQEDKYTDWYEKDK